MESLHGCPFGTVTVKEKTLHLCEKRGCRLQTELEAQHTKGGDNQDCTGNGPYWPEDKWSAYCDTVEDIVEQDQCLLGQQVQALIGQYTEEKRNANPPQLR